MDRPIAYKVVLFLGHATFTALFILAWQHAYLRTTSGDSAYQVFKWVNDAGLNVEAHRYSAIFPQLAAKGFKFFHADLSTLLLVASVTHVLVGYSVFLVCLVGLKAPRSAMAAALAAVLCTRLTFYGPVLEANYLLCYPFLFFAVLEQNGLSPLGVRSAFGLLLAGAFTLLVHPLGWLILLFGVVFLWSLRQLTGKAAIAVSASLVAGAMAVRMMFPPTAYEQAQYGSLLKAIAHPDPSGTWGSWDFLVGHTFHLTTNYLPALVVFVLVVIGLVLRKNPCAATVLAAGTIGYLALALVTFRAGDAAIMMDRGFLPVASLIALPAMYLLWQLRDRWRIMGSCLLVLVLFIKLRDISFGSREPQRQLVRTEQLLNDLRQVVIAKAEISNAELSSRGIQSNWAFPFGTLLISSREGPQHSVTVRVRHNGLDTKAGSDHSPTTPELDSSATELNERYFQLPRGAYKPF